MSNEETFHLGRWCCWYSALSPWLAVVGLKPPAEEPKGNGAEAEYGPPDTVTRGLPALL